MEQIDENLILDRFKKIKLIEKTQRYKKYLLKDVHSGNKI
jgi:hypothetical protein